MGKEMSNEYVFVVLWLLKQKKLFVLFKVVSLR